MPSDCPRHPLPPLPGDLLVAAVGPADHFFAGTVILILESDETGSLGLVLNRYADLAIDDVLPGWSPLVSAPEALFCGGPVELSGALCLARRGPTDVQAPLWRHVFGDVGLLNLDADPTLLHDAFSAVRIYAGYAGWGPGQLAQELARNQWYVVRGHADDVFTTEPEQLWRQVLRHSGCDAALFSTWTENPEWN